MNTDVQELAERQAALDAKLLEALRERAQTPGFTKDGEEFTEEEFEAFATEAEATIPRNLMNRADRRAAVAQFKDNLRHLPRAMPVRNPTIQPKKRRPH